jgi:hypothetical protein
MSRTDKDDPILETPKTESEAAMRAKCRSARDAPKCVKSTMDTEAPSLAKDLTDREDPK